MNDPAIMIGPSAKPMVADAPVTSDALLGHEIRAAQAVASEADWRPMAADVSDEARAALLRATYERSSSAATAS
jgi:hypothetical protein